MSDKASSDELPSVKMYSSNVSSSSPGRTTAIGFSFIFRIASFSGGPLGFEVLFANFKYTRFLAACLHLFLFCSSQRGAWGRSKQQQGDKSEMRRP
jgi:hypothetical protein